MPPSVYVETSIVSYLVARPSRDPIMAERQRQTRDWWENRRGEYRLFTSEITVDEALQGEAAMARKRIAALKRIPRLATRPAVVALGKRLVARGPLPSSAEGDAYHIAYAAVYGMDYLLTWDIRHIANPRTFPTMEKACREYGFELPRLCTPEEILGR
jgi:predicted nucleic acid-binding protein